VERKFLRCQQASDRESGLTRIRLLRTVTANRYSVWKNSFAQFGQLLDVTSRSVRSVHRDCSSGRSTFLHGPGFDARDRRFHDKHQALLQDLSTRRSSSSGTGSALSCGTQSLMTALPGLADSRESRHDRTDIGVAIRRTDRFGRWSRPGLGARELFWKSTRAHTPRARC